MYLLADWLNLARLRAPVSGDAVEPE